MGYVSCITLPRNKSWNGEETSAACDEITTCSKDGLIRVWNLNDYSVKGYFCLSKTPVTTITDTADHLTSRQQAHNMRQTNGLIPHYHINSNKPSGARVSNAYHDSTYTVHSSLTYPTPICVCYAANTQYSRADESIILSGWSDGKVRAVRCAPSSLSLGAGTMTMLWSLDCHNGSVTAIDCCSLYMVTGGMDSVVRIWSYGDVNDPSLQRQLITQLQDHTKPITGVRIDNTVQTILHTISADTTHKVYDLQQVSNSSQAIGLGRNNSAGSINPPRCVRTHDGSAEFSSKLKQHILLSSSDQRITNSAGFLCMVQRVDGEREVSIGCGDGRILFYDVDVAQRPIAVLEDRLGAAVCSMDIVSASVVFQSLKDKADSIDSKKL